MSVPTRSIYAQLLVAVQQQITNLGLPGAPNVVRRKKPLVSNDDQLPIIIVSPQPEKVYQQDTQGGLIIDYPILVTIATKGDELLETNVDQLLDWRESIRQLLYTTHLAGVPPVMDCNIELNPPFDPAYFKQQFDVSSIRFTFRAREGWTL